MCVQFVRQRRKSWLMIGRSPKKSIIINNYNYRYLFKSKEQSVQFNLFKTEYLLVDLTRVTVAGYG